MDGNVKRVFTRLYGIKDWAGVIAVEKKLWGMAEKNLPESKFGNYNQALMDLGATICVKKEPMCSQCPINNSCKSFLHKWTDIIPASKPKKEKLTEVSYFYIVQSKSKFLFIGIFISFLIKVYSYKDFQYQHLVLLFLFHLYFSLKQKLFYIFFKKLLRS